MGIQIEKTTYEPLPGGTYAARIREITQEEGQYGPQLKFRFEITAGELAGKTLCGWCSAIYSDKSKLAAWTRAVLGHLPPVFDSDALLDKPCRIAVLERFDASGAVKNRVDSVLPMQGATRPQPVTY